MKVNRIIVSAAGIGMLVVALTGCSGTFSVTAGTPSSSPQPVTSSTAAPVSSSAPSAPTAKTVKAAPGPTAVDTTPAAAATPDGVPNKPDVKCTNQINYAGDDRSNAEIDSIGSDTGSCPPFQHKPDVKCTDQYVYANDSRSNAEINFIGEDTGHCPFPQG